MSNFEDKMFECLKESFPYFKVEKQFYVKVVYDKYFFDFFIKELNVLIECHGEQHVRFIKHYHDDMLGFYKQKIRDRAKEAYAFDNNYILVVFFYDEIKKLIPEYVKEKINGTIIAS